MSAWHVVNAFVSTLFFALFYLAFRYGWELDSVVAVGAAVVLALSLDRPRP